jgi:hypothetical protein
VWRRDEGVVWRVWEICFVVRRVCGRFALIFVSFVVGLVMCRSSQASRRVLYWRVRRA